MKVVDSSGWIEFLTDGPLADEYAGHLQDLSQVLTPSVVLFEVYKWVKRERDEEQALHVAAQVGKTTVVPLTPTIALTAAGRKPGASPGKWRIPLSIRRRWFIRLL